MSVKNAFIFYVKLQPHFLLKILHVRYNVQTLFSCIIYLPTVKYKHCV